MFNPSAGRVMGLNSQNAGRGGELGLHSVADALSNFRSIVNTKAGMTPS